MVEFACEDDEAAPSDSREQELARPPQLGDAEGWPAKLKGSIGEGPNHSNFSDRSSVRILGIGRSEFFQNSGIHDQQFLKV